MHLPSIQEKQTNKSKNTLFTFLATAAFTMQLQQGCVCRVDGITRQDRRVSTEAGGTKDN